MAIETKANHELAAGNKYTTEGTLVRVGASTAGFAVIGATVGTAISGPIGSGVGAAIGGSIGLAASVTDAIRSSKKNQ